MFSQRGIFVKSGEDTMKTAFCFVVAGMIFGARGASALPNGAMGASRPTEPASLVDMRIGTGRATGSNVLGPVESRATESSGISATRTTWRYWRRKAAKRRTASLQMPGRRSSVRGLATGRTSGIPLRLTRRADSGALPAQDGRCVHNHAAARGVQHRLLRGELLGILLLCAA